MPLLNFFHPVLEALADGRVIRKTVVWVLRILAVLVVLGGLYAFVNILRFSFQAPAEATVGGLLLGLIFLVAVACVAQVLWYRSGKVDELSDTTFTVIPIVSILFRAMGEVYATLGAAVALGGCLFIWFAKTSPEFILPGLGPLLPSAPAGASFVGGLGFLAYVAVASFLVLVLFYFLAESTLLLVDIAHNMRLVREHFVPTPPAAAARPVAAPAPAPAPVPPAYQPPLTAPPPVVPPAPAYQPPTPPPAPRCPACAAEIEPGSAFCGNCGARLR